MSAGLDYYRGMTRPVQQPDTWRTCPEKCADHGHPGVTYNPWADRTWCLCGQVTRDGHHVALPKPTTPPGPLAERIEDQPCAPTS